MVISRESDYAIRLLRAVADGEKHTVKRICEAEKIPVDFAYKIIEKLRKAGFISSIRGKFGGIVLCCDLRKITLLELLYAIDGKERQNHCLAPGYLCEWEESSGRDGNVHRHLMGMQEQLNELLREKTLHTLLFE